MALKRGLMAPNTPESTKKARSMDMVSSSGQILLSSKATLSTITSKAMESTLGAMAASTQANGSAIRWRAEVCSRGPTAGNTRVNTWMIRNMDKVPLNGLMVANTLVSGKTASKMAKELISMRTEKVVRVSGSKESVANGVMMHEHLQIHQSLKFISLL
jgi:hypothetical protein